MTNDEFKTLTAGINASRLAELLQCSRYSVDRYRTGAPIPEKVARRVRELARMLAEFRRTNFVEE